MKTWFLCCLVAGVLCAATSSNLAASIQPGRDNGWVLATGGVEYRLGLSNGEVYLTYFGPAGGADWDGSWPGHVAVIEGVRRSDISGMAEGEGFSPANLELVSHQELHPSAGVDELELTYRHKRLPLQLAAQYFTWGDTGVITRQITLVNKGAKRLAISALPSLALELPSGPYDLTYLWGGWGHERQMATEALTAGEKSFVSTRGRSTNGYSPWFCLHSKNRDTRYLAQLAYSGNWEMKFQRLPGSGSFEDVNLEATLGMRPDFGGPLVLAPGESFALPAVAFTATSGSLDDGANQLHRYQRRYVVPRTPTNDPLLVQFNSWYPYPGKMQVDDMKRCADVAARLGAEAFVLDAGWFSSQNWGSELGDWTVNPQEFPHGLEELANYVRSKGMKFGMWVEIENLGADSKMFKAHPDWCLQYNGAPLRSGERYHLDFAKPQVRQWARSIIDGFVRDYGIEWLKIDYNIDVGERFDPTGLNERTGHVLYGHLTSYYRWLDEVRAAHPKLVIENCASGGTRFDLGIIAHTHTTWLSDEIRPLPSVQLAYGCTVEFMPEVCNHWMVGDEKRSPVVLSNPPGWWEFMLRVPMNGQYGISSRVLQWNEELTQMATANVALYKRIRQVIMGADVYHLTPQPDHDHPRDWSAIEYVSPDRKHSALLAYRLEAGAATRVFKLHGLDPAGAYRVSMDGHAAPEASGEALAHRGLEVHLDSEWRAAVIEIEARD